jgi:hypothetical protein
MKMRCGASYFTKHPYSDIVLYIYANVGRVILLPLTDALEK